jgi:transposase-like protein
MDTVDYSRIRVARMPEPIKLVPPGSFCFNPACPEYAQLGRGNITLYGKTGGGVQRFICRGCKKTFSATRGTPFYGVRKPEGMLLALRMVAERMSLAGISRVLKVKEESILAWLEKAAAHVEQIEALLQQTYQTERAQLDALWTFVAHKGEKGGAQRSRSVAPSGACGSSTSPRACASAAP